MGGTQAAAMQTQPRHKRLARPPAAPRPETVAQGVGDERSSWHCVSQSVSVPRGDEGGD